MFSEKFSLGRIVIGFLNFTDLLKIIFFYLHSPLLHHFNVQFIWESCADRQLIYFF